MHLIALQDIATANGGNRFSLFLYLCSLFLCLCYLFLFTLFIPFDYIFTFSLFSPPPSLLLSDYQCCGYNRIRSKCQICRLSTDQIHKLCSRSLSFSFSHPIELKFSFQIQKFNVTLFVLLGDPVLEQVHTHAHTHTFSLFDSLAFYDFSRMFMCAVCVCLCVFVFVCICVCCVCVYMCLLCLCVYVFVVLRICVCRVCIAYCVCVVCIVNCACVYVCVGVSRRHCVPIRRI